MTKKNPDIRLIPYADSGDTPLPTLGHFHPRVGAVWVMSRTGLGTNQVLGEDTCPQSQRNW